jgi:hypothetical protein
VSIYHYFPSLNPTVAQKPPLMKLEQWLTNICKTETPDKSIVAYWFGMFESDTYTLYLVGSNEYTPDDDDWACNADFVPREKYRALAGKGYSRLAWEDLLEKVKGELTDFMKTETFKTSFFADATAIAVGFDDGDLHLLMGGSMNQDR